MEENELAEEQTVEERTAEEQTAEGQLPEESAKSRRRRKAIFTGKYIAKVAMFSALAGVLYLIPGIPLSFIFAPWLELRFYDIPTVIGTYALGPLAGGIIVVMRFLLKIATVGTTSGYVGELGDILCGLAMVIPIGFIYKHRRNFKWAVLSLIIGTVATTAVAILVNRYMLIPFYAKLAYIGGIEGLVKTVSGLYQGVTVENFYAYYLGLSVVPFNLIRCIVTAAVTLPIYKRISNLLKKF